MKKFKAIMKCRKGSAILTVVIVMVVLILLGQAITMLTLGTLRSNVADSSNNEAYYAAESAIVSAIDQLKLEVVSYYSALEEASSMEFYAMFGSFANNINTNAQTKFVEPTLGGVTTSTTFSVGAYDSVNDICEFNIQSISTTSDNSRYQVNASVYVMKIDISIKSNLLSVPDNAALVVGGMLDLDFESGLHIVGGDAYVAGITFETFNKNVVPYKIIQGDLYIDSSIGDALEDPFVYPSYTNPNVNSPDLLLTEDTTLTSSEIPASPSVITTLPGVTLTLTSVFEDSIVYGQGDVYVTGSSGGSNYNIDLYVDGDLYILGPGFSGNIYCRGNVYTQNSVLNADIIADGNVSINQGSSEGTIIAGGSVYINANSVSSVASVGNITIENTNVSSGLIYSSSDIIMGNCNISAVVYAGDDINITGSMYLSGAIFAMDDFYFSNTGSQMNMGYDSLFVQTIVDEANINIFGAGGVVIIKPELDASIFVSQDITSIGRVN